MYWLPDDFYDINRDDKNDESEIFDLAIEVNGELNKILCD